jgi:hypothetical protein
MSDDDEVFEDKSRVKEGFLTKRGTLLLPLSLVLHSNTCDSAEHSTAFHRGSDAKPAELLCPLIT